MILAATPFAQADGWAAGAVVEIAKGWSQENLRIFLMDLGLESPSLHQPLGLPNQEGVSDAFLYGASVQRIAQPALDDAIFFAPAGTATTDPELILGHPRWNDLAGGFSEADATLLLYLPTDIPGAEKILAWATDIILLSGKGEAAEDHLGPAAVKVVGNFGPASAPPSRPEGGGAEPPESADADFEGAEREIGGVETDEFDLAHGLSISAGFAQAAGLDAPPGEGMEDDLVLEGPDAGLELEGTELQEAVPEGRDVPDFGADFVAMPTLENELETSDPEEAYEVSEAQTSGDEILPGSAILPEQEYSPARADSPPEAESEPPEKAGEAPPVRKEPPPVRRDRPRTLSFVRKKRKPPFSPGKVVVGVSIVVFLLAVLGTARGVFDIPGLMWLQDIFQDLPAPPMEVEGRDPLGPVLRYSLQLRTYDQEDLGLAIEMRDALRGRDPRLLFNLSPILIDGEVRYVLYAGPAVDALDAENLRAPLEGIFELEDPESWLPVVTPRAFYLGRGETLDEARGLLASVEAQGALAYILHTTYSDGSEGFEVLSGSFEAVEQARWWQEELWRKGFEDLALVERRGNPPE